MARRFYKRRKYGRRRSYRRIFKRLGRRYRRTRKGSRISRVRQKNLFAADRQYVKLRWNNTTRITASAAGVFTEFRGNSIFKPNATVLTDVTQPTGRDQWFAFYDRCVVMGSKIRCNIAYSESGAGAEFWSASIMPYTVNAGVPATSISYIEQPYTKWGFSAFFRQPLRLKNYMSTKKIFGRSGQLIEDDWREADLAQVPSDNEWRWRVTVNNNINDAANNPPGSVGPAFIHTIITYYVVFVDRKKLNFS